MLERLSAAFAAESLDFYRTAQAVVTVLCEEFADFAYVDVIDADGGLERAAICLGRLPADERALRRFAPPPEAPHPINLVLESGEPRIVPVCDDAWMVATTWSPEHLGYVRTLPLGSMAYMPLIVAGERIGVLTFGTVLGTERRFTEADLTDTREVAGRAAVALANARLYRDLAASEARYRNIIETAQEGVWIIDHEARTRYVNARLSEMLGYTADEMYGRPMFDFLVPGQQGDVQAALDRHRSGTGHRRESRLLHRDGRVVYAMVASNPILDPDGTYTGSLGMFTDITERKAIETQYRLLAEATPQIVWTAAPTGAMTYLNERWTALTGMAQADALANGWQSAVHPADVGAVLERVRLARERDEDLEAECRLRDADGRYRWHIVRARARRDERGIVEWLGTMTDVDASRRASEILARASVVLSGSLNLDTLLGRFADLLVATLGEEATIRLRPDRAVVRQRAIPAGGAAELVALLRHRDAEIGSVTLRASDPFAPSDAALLDELAARAAVAIENAQLYEREHRVAMTLQRAMLPAVLPHVAWLEFDAVYYPGLTEAEIGGDWYDAIALPDGRVVISIGDVTGRGLTAAVIMGRMRQAIETLSTYESDPGRLLDAVDKVLRRAHPDAIVTALVGVVEPDQGTLSYATAGHPTPVVCAPDGSIRHLPGRGLPLGLRDGGEPPTMSIELPPGSLTVFFTDGLIEATRDIAEGERRVVAALRNGVPESASPAAALVAQVLGGDGVHDDVAVLTLRLLGDRAARAWTMRWRFDPRDWRRAHDVRETVVEALELHGRDVDIPAAELVFGELIGNAVRHAPGPIDVELTIDDPGRPVLHVIDDGPGYSSRALLPSDDSESGRGLYLVSTLTREFTVTRADERGAHARAVLQTLG
ncbi:MAG TPA: PAS domain S-box protein [Candidatus Elarobacter sp.]|nr:PAS domain S-box protein [Candidatus Elarobacter sp.]